MVSLGEAIVVADFAGVEDGLGETADRIIVGIAGVDQTLELAAGDAACSREGELRKVPRAGYSDVGVGLDEEFFRAANVRPALEQIRGQAHRYVCGMRRVGDRLATSDGAGIAAEQKAQVVLLLLDLALKVWNLRLCSVVEFLCLTNIGHGVGTALFKLLRELKRLLACVEGVAGDD